MSKRAPGGERQVGVALLDRDRVQVRGTVIRVRAPNLALWTSSISALGTDRVHVRAGEDDMLVVRRRRVLVVLERVALRHGDGDRHHERLREVHSVR